MTHNTVSVDRYLPQESDLAMARSLSPVMADMQGSKILGIASQVRQLQAQGREICNLTVGDFRPGRFPIPEALSEQVSIAYGQGQTNYPPADGVPELKEAIAGLYKREMGLDYGSDSVCVGSGARPPLYASWRLLTKPGDVTVSFLPSWNMGYYAHFCQTDHRFVPTTADNNFFPTPDQVSKAIVRARMLLINSPLNPTGTAISADVLEGIARAIVDENKRRGSDPPVMLVYDQVYWMLTANGVQHHNPVQLVPEVAPFVINIDAISKCFAATGLRVGWGVMPRFIQPKMRALIGHMGAWPARPEQLATAWLLNHPEVMHQYMGEMKQRVADRLDLLFNGVMEMKAAGLPVDAIAPQGAIYLTLNVDLIGRGFDSNEGIRHYLLEEAGVAVVPFQAFDMPEETGWFRMSVGAVSCDELDDALGRIQKAIRAKI